MAGAGSAVMGIGRGTGENRARQAADKAIASPMLETSMEGARGVLLSIAGPTSMTLHEVNEAATAVSEHCEDDANVIFGATVDDAMGDEMRVTVIAAGFDVDRARPRDRQAPASPSAAPLPSGLADAEEESGEPGADDDFEIPDFLKG